MSPLADLVRPGSTVAVADGSGTPVELLAELSVIASAVGDVRLVLGWCTAPLDDLDLAAFSDVCALTGGYALRRALDTGLARQLPARLGNWPALLADVLRPDVLVASVVRYADGYRFGSDPAWVWAAVDAGARIAAVERSGPHCVTGPPLPTDRLTLLGTAKKGPTTFRWGVTTDVQHEIGNRIATLLPPGARLQFAPGGLGAALVGALKVPVHIDTGVLTETVATLDHRGLLSGPPRAPYAIGEAALFDWLADRPVLDRAEVTHDPGRLRHGPPLFAVNTALEIDLDGQVNVESVGGRAVGTVGGQPDFMAGAAASPGGLSIMAVPTSHGGRSTLVEHLSAPASTPSHDVDLVVTERGTADLRGRSRRERRTLIEALWR